MSNIYQSLVAIVGEEYVSNQAEELYIHARAYWLMPSPEPDYVVAPKSTEEVQEIVRLANKEKVPIVPMGGGMASCGILPLKRGIVIDMRRMRKILGVNEKARYVIVEAGVSQGVLLAHLKRNYPRLRHSVPEGAPAPTTIAGSVVVHGQGSLTYKYGFHSDMVSGLEVVLPTGDVCKIGSCAMSADWFSKGPTLPDLSGLFLGWLGTTGIITKVGLKLYPKKKIRDVEIFVTDKADLIPDIVFNLTHTEMLENIVMGSQSGIRFDPPMLEGYHYLNLYISADTDDELALKRTMVWAALKEFRDSKDGGFMWVPSPIKRGLLELPQKSFVRTFGDDKKGGAFGVSAPIALIEKYPSFTKKLEEVADKYQLAYGGVARVIGTGHAMNYNFTFPSNRADRDLMDRTRKALLELETFALTQGGIPGKPSIEEQKIAMERMDPNTLKLMKVIKESLDPNGIMNPGYWEVS